MDENYRKGLIKLESIIINKKTFLDQLIILVTLLFVYISLPSASDLFTSPALGIIHDSFVIRTIGHVLYFVNFNKLGFIKWNMIINQNK